MATDLTIGLAHAPGTLAEASDALGRAGVNIEGAAGYVCEGEGVYHVLTSEPERARRALIDAGFEIHGERSVVVVPIEDRPGAAAEVLRRVAEAGVNVDLLYNTVAGGLVLAGDDMIAIRRALG